MIKYSLVFLMILFPYSKDKSKGTCYITDNYRLWFLKDGNYELLDVRKYNPEKEGAIISYGKFKDIGTNTTLLIPIIDGEMNKFCFSNEFVVPKNQDSQLLILNESGSVLWIRGDDSEFRKVPNEFYIDRRASLDFYSQDYGLQKIEIDIGANKLVIHSRDYCLKRYGRRSFASFLKQRTFCIKEDDKIMLGNDTGLLFFKRR